VDRVLSLLADWPPALIYLVTAVVAAAETGTLLGLLVPGEITLLIVGFLCWQGVLRLPVALAAMIVAGLVGDSRARRVRCRPLVRHRSRSLRAGQPMHCWP
jgi:membrane protein DedA with SNARE-associated domain